MVIKTEEGWLGADDKFYDGATAAKESFAEKFGWPEPVVSNIDKVAARRLRVFLSYAEEDTPAVRKLYDRLKSVSVDPWIDRVKLIPGRNWPLEISKAIRSTDRSRCQVIRWGNAEKIKEEARAGFLFLLIPRIS